MTTLFAYFILKEKITHVVHKKIPERIVHARESADNGVFKLYSSVVKYIKAGFLKDTERETSVFICFSTIPG